MEFPQICRSVELERPARGFPRTGGDDCAAGPGFAEHRQFPVATMWKPGGDEVVDVKGISPGWRGRRIRLSLVEGHARYLGATDFPKIETLIATGDVAFRQHSSGHTDQPNWPRLLGFLQ